MHSRTFDSRNSRVNVWLQRRLDEQGWDEAVEAHWVLIHAMEDIYKRRCDPPDALLGELEEARA